MKAGERQVAPSVDGIRYDHVARYMFATKLLKPGARIIDFACGVGYGSHLMAREGHRVTGYDIDREAVAYAVENYSFTNGASQATFELADGNVPPNLGAAELAVCFETVEHMADPRPLLKALRKAAPQLIASVPNEAVMPWRINDHTVTAFHFRHYTKDEFKALLAECGWQVTQWHGQADATSDVARNVNGRTLIATAKRGEAVKRAGGFKPSRMFAAPQPAPEHVAILGLGPSMECYVQSSKRLGARRRFCDEVWGINAAADIVHCDRVFHMDDVRIQEIRAKAAPDSNIAAMLGWIRTHPGPIYTSRVHEGYPGLVAFPLEAMLNVAPFDYFNSTAAYAVGFAILIGVKKISLFGMDFTYPNAHDAEKGRACVEFWLGIAHCRGIKIAIAKESSLLDSCHSRKDRLYGYDTLDVDLKMDAASKVTASFKPVEKLPTAEEIEERYDHSKHPSPLVTD